MYVISCLHVKTSEETKTKEATASLIFFPFFNSQCFKSFSQVSDNHSGIYCHVIDTIINWNEFISCIDDYPSQLDYMSSSQIALSNKQKPFHTNINYSLETAWTGHINFHSHQSKALAIVFK